MESGGQTDPIGSLELFDTIIRGKPRPNGALGGMLLRDDRLPP